MNLSNIRTSCPKAYEKYKFFKNTTIVKYGNIRARDLYKFFDKNHLIIEVFMEYNFEKEISYDYKWLYNVHLGKKFSNQSSDNITYSSREKCEEFAFYKAFELLEKRLCDAK